MKVGDTVMMIEHHEIYTNEEGLLKVPYGTKGIVVRINEKLGHSHDDMLIGVNWENGVSGVTENQIFAFRMKVVASPGAPDPSVRPKRKLRFYEKGR